MISPSSSTSAILAATRLHRRQTSVPGAPGDVDEWIRPMSGEPDSQADFAVVGAGPGRASHRGQPHRRRRDRDRIRSAGTRRAAGYCPLPVPMSAAGAAAAGARPGRAVGRTWADRDAPASSRSLACTSCRPACRAGPLGPRRPPEAGGCSASAGPAPGPGRGARERRARGADVQERPAPKRPGGPGWPGSGTASRPEDWIRRHLRTAAGRDFARHVHHRQCGDRAERDVGARHPLRPPVASARPATWPRPRPSGCARGRTSSPSASPSRIG